MSTCRIAFTLGATVVFLKITRMLKYLGWKATRIIL